MSKNLFTSKLPISFNNMEYRGWSIVIWKSLSDLQCVSVINLPFDIFTVLKKEDSQSGNKYFDTKVVPADSF